MLVCVHCSQQMRPKKNSVEFVETARLSGRTSDQSPYKLWSGDLWECQRCGSQIVFTDSRQTPIAEHYEPGFAKRCAAVEIRAAEWSRA